MTIAAAMALTACGDEAEAPLVAEEILQLHAESDQVVFGLEHYVTTEGVRRALIIADTAFFLENQNAVELRSLQVTFYDRDGTVTSVLTSQKGTYDWNSGDMTAIDEVIVLNPEEGRRVETSIMHYDRLRNRIWSDSTTHMYETDGTVIEGTAFESDASLRSINLTSARLERPGGPPRNEP